MAGIKRLRSVAQSLAHHALSGSCPDAPERALEQRRSGVERISVLLLRDSDVPESLLQSKFYELLSKEGISPETVVAAKADFIFSGQCRTADECIVSVETTDGRRVEGEA